MPYSIVKQNEKLYTIWCEHGLYIAFVLNYNLCVIDFITYLKNIWNIIEMI